MTKQLTPDQLNFCELFVSPKTEFYGNGTQSYLEAYRERKTKTGKKSVVTYDAAKANAYKLLTKPEIIEKINSLLEAQGFNDENVDKQHLFLLNQYADLKTKLGAITEYNKLRKRVESGNKTLIFAGNQITFTNYGKPEDHPSISE
jgi:hypothetical protein